MYPNEYKYSRDHEWVRVEGDVVVLGITEFAQRELGDVVFVELPQVGNSFDAGDELGTIESVKAVSEIYTPVSGEIIEANDSLNDEPEQINTDPHGDGWLVKIRMRNPGEISSLMDAATYEEYIKGGE